MEGNLENAERAAVQTDNIIYQLFYAIKMLYLKGWINQRIHVPRASNAVVLVMLLASHSNTQGILLSFVLQMH